MLSIYEIVAISAQAARKAARKHLAPYTPWDASEIETWTHFPFPFIGSYQPKGWTRLETVLADGTGRGSGPALTIDGLKTWCANQIAINPGRSVGFAVVETGEFQAVIASYLRNK
jgi:hypothetical protein